MTIDEIDWIIKTLETAQTKLRMDSLDAYQVWRERYDHEEREQNRLDSMKVIRQQTLLDTKPPL